MASIQRGLEQEKQIVPRGRGFSLRTVLDTRLSGLLLVVGLLLAAEFLVASGYVEMMSVPRVSDVITTLYDEIVSGQIPTDLYHTLRRMAIGYATAAICGVAIGMAMGYFRRVYNLLEPITELLRPLPSPAYIPIVILFLGLGDKMSIFVVFFSCLWPIVLNTMAGVRGISSVQLNTARTFGLSNWQTLRKVVIPTMAPSVFTGLRISLAVALILAIIAEMIASQNGIGHYILFSQRAFRVEEMYAGVVTLAAIGYLLNRLFLAVESRVLAWHFATSGMEP